MIPRTDRIRTHLERHEYTIEFEAMFWRWSTFDDEGNFESEAECLEDALTGFLNDTNKDMARVADFPCGVWLQPLDEGEWLAQHPTSTIPSERPQATGPTPEIATRELWRRTFIDPKE